MNKLLSLATLLLLVVSAKAQNSMGVGTTTPNPNAVLELVSPTKDQGLLVPRVTTAERTATSFTTKLTSTENGLMVFDTDESQFYFWFSEGWQPVANNNAVDTLSVEYIQLGNNLDIFHYFHPTLGGGGPFDAEMIGANFYARDTTFMKHQDGPSSAIFMDEGAFQFLHVPDGLAGEIALNDIKTSVEIKESMDVEFRGGIEVGELQDSTSINSGTLAFSQGAFYGHDGTGWKNLGGLSFPSENFIDESSSTPFLIDNIGSAGVARFVVNNISTFDNAVSIVTNAENTNSSGLSVNHDGLGTSAEFLVNNSSNSNNALYVKTDGLGGAGRFEINNNINNSSALLGTVNAGTGNAIEGINNGEGLAGRFTQANSSSSVTAFSVQNQGSGSIATFQNTGTAGPLAAVSIIQNGSGPWIKYSK